MNIRILLWKGWLVLPLLLLQSLQAQGYPRQMDYPFSMEVEWKENKDASFTQKYDIGDAFADEKQVILGYKAVYQYNRVNPENKTIQAELVTGYRWRIKLLTQGAVEEQSEFEYDAKAAIGIRIVKPDGREIYADTSEAVHLEGTEENSYYSGKKLAIRELEVGDVIDYFVEYKAAENTMAEYFEFPTQYYTVAFDDPVMYQNVTFYVPDDHFHVAHHSYNGAPEIVKTALPQFRANRYEFEYGQYTPPMVRKWNEPYRYMPYVKFYVLAASGKKALKRAISLEVPEVYERTELNDEHIYELGQRLYKWRKGYRTSMYYLKPLAGKAVRGLSGGDEAEAKRVYNMFRHYFISSPTLSLISSESYFASFGQLRDEVFIGDFGALLYSRRIPFEFVLVYPYKLGAEIEEGLVPKDFIPGFKVGNTFYFNPTRESVAGQVPSWMEGSAYYAFNYLEKKNMQIKKGRLPMTTPEDNRQMSQWEVTVGEDLDEVLVEGNSYSVGFQSEWDRNVVLIDGDFVYQEIRMLPQDYYGLYQVRHNYPEAQELVDRIHEEQVARREEYFRSSLTDDFGEVELEKVQTLTPGRGVESDTVSYRLEFTAKELFHKAGPNYLFDLGKFLTGQVAIDENDREREIDVYMESPRTYVTQVSLPIPSGWEVVGLEKMEKDVANETGSFRSHAYVKDGVLYFESTKVYQHGFEPVENWPKMIEFLDAAYDITQKKVLFKKTGA